MNDNFNHNEQLANDASGFNIYAADEQQQTKRKPQFDEGEGKSITLEAKENFKTNTYYFIIDRLKMELNKRCESYMFLSDKFHFLTIIKIIKYFLCSNCPKS